MIERYLNANAMRSKNDGSANSNLPESNPPYDRIEELRKIIRAELKLSHEDTMPHVTAMRKSTEGEKQIEDLIVRYVTEECKPIVIALVLIEKELSEMSKNKS